MFVAVVGSDDRDYYPQSVQLRWLKLSRDVAQPGSAPEWGSGGRGFKSRRPDSPPLCGANRTAVISPTPLALLAAFGQIPDSLWPKRRSLCSRLGQIPDSLWPKRRSLCSRFLTKSQGLADLLP